MSDAYRCQNWKGSGSLCCVVSAPLCCDIWYQISYSLSTPKIHYHLPFAIVFLKESFDDLLDGMHSQPISTIDKRVAADILGSKWLVKIWLVAQVQFRDTSFRHNTAVVCLVQIESDTLP